MLLDRLDLCRLNHLSNRFGDPEPLSHLLESLPAEHRDGTVRKRIGHLAAIVFFRLLLRRELTVAIVMDLFDERFNRRGHIFGGLVETLPGTGPFQPLLIRRERLQFRDRKVRPLDRAAKHGDNFCALLLVPLEGSGDLGLAYKLGTEEAAAEQ